MRVQGARRGLKINVKNITSLRLGIGEDIKVTLDNERIYQVDSFTYLGSNISKDGGGSEDGKIRLAKAQCVCSQLEKVEKDRRISRRTKIRILEATVMTVVKYGSEPWAHRKKTDEDLQGVFREIAYGLFWVPGRLTVFQTVGFPKRAVQSRFLGL
ncbi:uncharacterized protein LOC136034884 [Artemia franciscana]|uniref:uncharacterized protein LOC136034884 n=1 Tax=Artemia franciscana TaxID=6661 RepID=UPI0032D9E621